MAVTLKQLCENSNFLYSMRVLAGKDGMNNIVQWVHTIEDCEVCEFIHGGELIFTTGIAQKGTDWLLPFVKILNERGASGLVINIGPYITECPQNVKEYCEQINFPLLDVPWKTRLVDITRGFCNQIIQKEKENEDMADTFKNLIFYPQDLEKYIQILQRLDFQIVDKYCVAAISLETTEHYGNLLNFIKMQIETQAIASIKKFGCFDNGKEITLIFYDYFDDEIKKIMCEIQRKANDDSRIKSIYIGVGINNISLEDMPKAYRKSLAILKLAKKMFVSPLYYDQLEAKKILICVDEQDVLADYCKKILGKLVAYDEGNGTNLVEILRKYMECDCSVQLLAKQLFAHRNTINYKINKIKKILEKDVLPLNERFEIMLALQIMDII